MLIFIIWMQHIDMNGSLALVFDLNLNKNWFEIEVFLDLVFYKVFLDIISGNLVTQSLDSETKSNECPLGWSWAAYYILF